MLSRRIRPLDGLEFIVELWNMCLQTSIEFEKSSDVRPALEEIVNCCNAFHTSGAFFIHPIGGKVPIYRIPPGLKTLPEVNEWMFRAHPTKMWKRNGTIAIDDTRIVMNTSHVSGDGRYLSDLIEHLSRPTEHWKMAPIPRSASEQYEKEIFAHPQTAVYCAADQNLSRIFPKKKTAKKNPLYGIHTSFTPFSQFKYYDPKNHCLHKLSENIWTSLVLTNAAFNQTSVKNSKFSISTVYDLRRLNKEEAKKDPAIQNYIASLPVSAYPTENTTVGELGALMRKDFVRGVKDKDFFSHMRTVWEAVFRPWRHDNAPGYGIEMTSIGNIKIKSPIKDVHLSLMCDDSMGLGQISYFIFSKEFMEKGKKELVSEFQYNSQEIHPDDAFVFNKSVEYAMKKLNDSIPIKQAIDELAQFQKSLQK